MLETTRRTVWVYYSMKYVGVFFRAHPALVHDGRTVNKTIFARHRSIDRWRLPTTGAFHTLRRVGQCDHTMDNDTIVPTVEVFVIAKMPQHCMAKFRTSHDERPHNVVTTHPVHATHPCDQRLHNLRVMAGSVTGAHRRKRSRRGGRGWGTQDYIASFGQKKATDVLHTHS